MANLANQPLFGLNIDPGARGLDQAFRLARLVDDTGLDLIAVQDHPYIPTFLETWTLLSALGARTERVHLLPNVLNLALRPPAVLAKAAASLDLITGGRVEFGLGSGANWDGIAGYGGSRREPGDAVASVEEAIQIARAIWQPATAEPVSLSGTQFHLENARPGPGPAHPMRIWLGVSGPRMLRLTGRLADGWIITNTYFPPERLGSMQAEIDAGAERAGRERRTIRRAYNVMGAITSVEGVRVTSVRQGGLVGTASEWVEHLVDYAGLGMDTFIFWPLGGQEEQQASVFAEEVAPGVREAIQSSKHR